MNSSLEIPGKYRKIHDYLMEKFPELKKEIDHYCRQTLPSLAKKGYIISSTPHEFFVKIFDNLKKNHFTAEICFILTREWLDRKPELRDVQNFSLPCHQRITNSDIKKAIYSILNSNPHPKKKNSSAALRYWMGLIMIRFRGYIPGSVVYNQLQSVLKIFDKI